jgi:hypothetical protein
MTTAAANALTARWAATLDGGQTVLSGAGVQPLLALLARYAAGPARDELLAVAGSGSVAGEGSGLLDSPTTRLAVGVWSRHDLPLTARWRAEVPGSLRGQLTGDPAVDQPVLDRWAAERTDGLVPALPVTVDRGTLLVLASALVVVTRWAEPFTDGWCRPGAGPWRGRDLAGLHRRTFDLEALRVARTPVGALTLLTVRGDEGVDVMLALGPEGAGAAQVLPAAVTALDRIADGAGPDPADLDGPGISVQVVPAPDDRPELVVSTVGFTVRSGHDLLRRPELFGLCAATDGTSGHFPGISPAPLVVSQARQDAVATFGARGFRAAAVTAIATRAGAAPGRDDRRKRRVRLDVDRPFGFLAVHRPTGLVLVAGWVTDPDPHPTD